MCLSVLFFADMRKPTFCVCENKDADQLCSNAQLISIFVFDTQSLFFPVPNFKLLICFCDCTARFVSDMFENYIVTRFVSDMFENYIVTRFVSDMFENYIVDVARYHCCGCFFFSVCVFFFF